MVKTEKCFDGMYVDYVLGDLKENTGTYDITMWDIDVNKEFNLKNRKKLNFKKSENSNIIWGASNF